MFYENFGTASFPNYRPQLIFECLVMGQLGMTENHTIYALPPPHKKDLVHSLVCTFPGLSKKHTGFV
jgi:hypothetical protein